MKKLTVKTQTITDIKGKQLLYAIIGDGTGQVIMNIGQKTYDNLNALLNQAEIPNLEEQKPKENASKVDNKK